VPEAKSRFRAEVALSALSLSLDFVDNLSGSLWPVPPLRASRKNKRVRRFAHPCCCAENPFDVLTEIHPPASLALAFCNSRTNVVPQAAQICAPWLTSSSRAQQAASVSIFWTFCSTIAGKSPCTYTPHRLRAVFARFPFVARQSSRAGSIDMLLADMMSLISRSGPERLSTLSRDNSAPVLGRTRISS
jgi:hypothetical protein